jgi:hypothetical protein
MRDESKVRVVPARLRAAFLVISRVAFVIMLLAGLINLVVGPRNPVIFVLAFFQLGFAWLVLAGADMHPPVEPPFFVGRRGPMLAAWILITRILDCWLSVLMPVFLCVAAALFLVSALAISYFVVTRIV